MGQDVTAADIRSWLAAFRDAVHEHGAYLTELDSAIGDADHGSNLVRGMDAVMAAVDDESLAPGELLKKAATTLVSSVGGSSGPLYGTFFLRAAAVVGPAETLDGAAVLEALRAGVEGIVARGHAEPGDKTMYDALAPAVEAYADALGGGASAAEAAEAAASAAREGRDATEPMQARKGRASYLGERSVGHLDPGAASAALLVEALADALAGQAA